MLRRRSSNTNLSGSPEASWTGAAEINYVEMSFARVPIFKECSRDELLRVGRVTRIREHLDGDVIIHEGAKGRDFFVLLEGKARITRGGEEVATIERGDFFGELARSILRRGTPPSQQLARFGSRCSRNPSSTRSSKRRRSATISSRVRHAGSTTSTAGLS